MTLDPDDPRPPYQQVANALRASILTGKFEPGEKLPTQAELAKHYGVARMTVTQALRVLRDDGLIASRQGSGVFVRERTAKPVGLRPHIEATFEQEHARIDFAGFSGETLHGAISEAIDKVRVGRLTPKSVRVRLLLPDMSVPMALPSRAGSDPGDDPAVRKRSAKITSRNAEAIVDAVEELGQLGLVEEAHGEIRLHTTGPQFKLYLLGESEAFFGFYPVVEHTVKIGSDQVPIFDAMGKDATLFHYATSYDETDTDTQFVRQARLWFDSMWDTISRPGTP